MLGISKKYYFPIFLVLYEMAVYLSNDMYLPALQDIGTLFGASDLVLQSTITMWIIGSAALLPFLGPITDRYGQRIVILCSGIVFLIGLLGCAYAINMKMLLFMRFLQGTAVCSIMIAGYGAIHENFDGKEVIVILSRMVIVAVISPMIGPLIGGYLLLISDWSISFKLISMWTIIVLLGLYKTIPPSKHLTKRLEMGSIFKHYAMLIRLPNFIWGSLAYGLVFGCLVMWITISPLLLMTYYELTPEAFGWSQLPIFSAFSLGSFMIQRLINSEWRPLKIVFLGMCFMFLGASAFLYVTLYTKAALWEVLSTLAFTSFGAGFVMSPLNRLLLSINVSTMGMKTSLFNIITTGIVVLTSFLMSLCYNSRVQSLSLGMWVTIFLSFICCLIYRRILQIRNLDTVLENSR